MSNLLDILMSQENAPVLKELSKQFDLSPDQTRSAVKELIPALSRGMKNNTSQGNGMDDLLEALRTGKHERYMEQPTSLGDAATTRDGNDILGHVFGSKEVSREVASRASKTSGISSTLLKKMLPVIATVALGALSKGVFGGAKNPAQARANGAGGILGTLLDGDRDGSIWDDVLGMAARGILR